MPRLYLFAEGRTEQTFADTVLKHHLATFNVFLHKPMLIAHARRKGVTHRGGGRRYEPMLRDIRGLLRQDSAPDAFFTTMIDLYALHAGFPGVDEATSLCGDPIRRVESLEAAWAKDVKDRRFIPFIQLHEFEAYLFVDVGELRAFYPNQNQAIENLRAVAQGAPTPECIDDGPTTAPSKRLIAELPDYEAAKTVVGPQVGERIGIAKIRSHCPHFNDWLTKLENLGGRETGHA